MFIPNNAKIKIIIIHVSQVTLDKKPVEVVVVVGCISGNGDSSSGNELVIDIKFFYFKFIILAKYYSNKLGYVYLFKGK